MEHAFEQLEKNHVHWGRESENKIYVYTSGYKTRECYQIESFLMECGLYALSMKFDRQCGKTRTVYIIK